MKNVFRWLAPAVVLGAGVVFFQAPATAEDAAPPAATQPAATGSIVVTVNGADNKPVADVEVMIVAVPARPAEGEKPPEAGRLKPVAHDKTAADGTVTLSGVPAGEYFVRAHLKGVGEAREKVTIDASKQATLTLTLAPRAPRAASGGGDGGGNNTAAPAK